MSLIIPELGVFAKRPIPKFTQFGPFVGELVELEAVLTNSGITVVVSQTRSLFVKLSCLFGFKAGFSPL